MGTFGDFFQALQDVMSTDRDLFIQTGASWLSDILVFMVAIFGARTMFMGWDWHRFWKLLITYFLLATAIEYYAKPSPVFGISFTHLVTDETKVLSDTLANQSESVLFATMVNFQTELDKSLPIVPSVGQWIRYIILALLIIILEGLVWAVIAWGFIATAICIILGPLFLPWALVPGMEWLTWGWLRSFIGYCFYSVVATCYVLIASRILTYFTAAHPPPYSTVDQWLMLAPAALVLTCLVVGVLQIPSLTNSLFSGRTGESAVPKFVRSVF